MVYSQASRAVRIGTSLEDDEVQLVGFSGQEGLSELFQFHLELISMHPDLRPEDLIGQNLTFSIDHADGRPRHFNGHVERLSSLGENHKGRGRFVLTVVPWFWFLTQITDCRIFQGMTAVEILEEVFQSRGFVDFELKLTGEYAHREYCVQYLESDFDFASRLMEEEGIFYFFRHENGKHFLVLADSNLACQECQDSPVDFPPSEQASRHHEPHLTGWQHTWQFRSGAWAHTDFNFQYPGQDLLAQERTVVRFANASRFERFEYPGCYPDKGVGQPRARIRMEEIEASVDVVNGASTCPSFTPGGRFTIGRHRDQIEEGRTYILRQVRHQGQNSGYDSGSAGEGPQYQNTFTCFPETYTFRPERVTPKAVMRGCQTAIVTGPEGEEIHTDEFGRVKVKFHWDRWGPSDDRSSCWVRVSQPHAGGGWGHIDLPRVGEEVIVDFLDGDPDRPIIVGRVYNGCNRVPYQLPGNKTISGYKSKSYREDGKNEMLIDDTAGKEQIVINAQKDMNTTVANDQSLKVGNDRSSEITGNDNETVGKDKFVGVTGMYGMHSDGLMSLGSESEIILGVGSSSISIIDGMIEISSKVIKITGESMVATEAMLVTSNASGQNILKGGVVIIN